MVVAHRLAPVRHRERGIGLLRALERDRRFVELEAVKALHAFEERGLRGRRPEVGNVMVPSSCEFDGERLQRARHGDHANRRDGSCA